VANLFGKESNRKMRKRRLCVVDDDPEELRRFREYMETRFIIGAGTSLDAALEDLRRQGHSSPDLYVLDLYFPQGGTSTQEQLEDLANARKRLLDSHADFASLLAKLGQAPQGGFRLAGRLSRFGQRAPFVFFSRKATAEDVVQGLDIGALRVIKKQDPTADDTRGRTEAGP
jgi:DNA-binding response OmpR family regulator